MSGIGELVRFAGDSFDPADDALIPGSKKKKHLESNFIMVLEVFKDYYVAGEILGGFVGITCNTVTALAELHMQVVGTDYRGNVFHRSELASFQVSDNLHLPLQAEGPGTEMTPGDYCMAIRFKLDPQLRPNILGKKKEKLVYHLVVTLIHTDRRTSTCEAPFAVAPDPGPPEDCYIKHRLHMYASVDRLVYYPGSVVKVRCQIPHFDDEKAHKLKAMLVERHYTKVKDVGRFVRSENILASADKFWDISEPEPKLFNRPEEEDKDPTDKIGFYGSTLKIPLKVPHPSTTFVREQQSQGAPVIAYHFVKLYLPGGMFRKQPLVEAVVPLLLEGKRPDHMQWKPMACAP